MKETMHIRPVGHVAKSKDGAAIEIYPEYADGLQGMEAYSHIVVLYWFHENDSAEQRRTLKVHPRGNPANPLTGVFATRSPVRPNLIAVSTCRVVSVTGTTIVIEDIDAYDGSPIVDIKGYMPEKRIAGVVKVPGWAKR